MPIATIPDDSVPAENIEPADGPATNEDLPGPPSSDDAIDALVAKFAGASQEAQEAPQEPEPAAAAPEPPPEPPKAPEPAQAPAPSPQERNLAILADRQRAIRAEQEALAAERAALKAEREAVEKDLARWRGFETKLMRGDALGALTDIGVRLDDVNRAVLEGRGVNPTSQLEASLQGKIQETERRLAQRLDDLQRAEHARLERAFFDETRHEIASRSPFLAAMGDTAVQAIYQRFQQHAHQGEQLPSYADVIRAVEEEALEFIRPLLDTETVRGLLPRQPRDASPTLSNKQAAAAPPRNQEDPPTYTSPYDDNESYIDALVRKHAAQAR